MAKIVKVGWEEKDAQAMAKSTIAEMAHTAVIKQGTAAILAQAKAWLTTPVGIFTIIATGIYAAVKAYNYFNVTLEESIKKTDELDEKIKQMTEDQSSEYSQLLARIDTLTDAERIRLGVLQEQLDNLKAQRALQAEESVDKYYDQQGYANEQGGYGTKYEANETKLDAFYGLDSDAENNGWDKTQTEKARKLRIETIAREVDQIQELVDSGGVLTDEQQSQFEEMKKVVSAYYEEVDAQNALGVSTLSVSETLSKLASSKEQISTLSTAFKELSENGSVSFGTLKDISDKFGETVPNIDDYINALSNAKGNTEETSKILSDLTYASLEAQLGTAGLANATESQVVAMLKEAGVANADEIATYSLAKAKEKLAMSSAYASGGIEGLIAYISSVSGASVVAESALNYLAAQIITTGNTELSLDQQRKELQALAADAYGAGSMMASVLSNKAVSDYMSANHVNTQQAQAALISESMQGFKDAMSDVPTPDYTGLGSSNGSSDSEEYLATLDKTYLAKKKLAEIQKEIIALETQSDLTDDPKKKLEYLNQTVVLLKKEQAALHDIAEINRSQILENNKKLTDAGFKVDYDSANNNFAVENMEHINELAPEVRKEYEDLIGATDELNQANEDNSESWWDIQKSLSEVADKYDDIKASALDAYDKIIDAIQDSIDKEIEALEVQKEHFEDLKDNLETTVSFVVDGIQDQIDALQDENDALDKQLEVEQKLEALEKAKTQKNKKVFIEGQGFVWKADQSAVNSTQSDYDELIRKNNLDAQIEKLQKYSDLWQNVVDGYQEGIDEATASGILTSFLGSDWLTALSNMDTSVLDDLTSYYSSTSQQLDEDVSGSVANQIKNLEELSDEWDDSSKQIKTAAEGYTTTLSDVKTFEALSYSERLLQIKSFTTEAINALNALAIAQAAAGSSKTVTVQSDGNAQAGLNSGDTVKSADGKSAWTIVDAGTSGATYNPNSGYWSVKKYSDGGVVDYTGMAQVHGGSAAEMVLNNSDVGKVYDLIHNSDSIAETLISQANIGRVSSLSSNVKPSQAQNITISIGDINIEHADDADSLATDIKKRFPNIMKQEFYKNK